MYYIGNDIYIHIYIYVNHFLSIECVLYCNTWVGSTTCEEVPVEGQKSRMDALLYRALCFQLARVIYVSGLGIIEFMRFRGMCVRAFVDLATLEPTCMH